MTAIAMSSSAPEYSFPRDEVTIRFIGMSPDDEVVRAIQRSAARMTYASSPVEVTVEPHRYGSQVRIQGVDSPYPVTEVEADVFVAIRNAFARWDATASIQLASSRIGRA